MDKLDLLIACKLIWFLLFFNIGFVIEVSKQREHESVLNDHRPQVEFRIGAVGREKSSSVVEEKEGKLKLKIEEKFSKLNYIIVKFLKLFVKFLKFF